MARRSLLWGLIDAEPVVFPVRSHDLDALTLAVAAPVEQVAPFVPPDFAPVVAGGGTVDVLVVVHAYAAGDWGPLNAVDVGFRSRPVGGGRGETGWFLHEAPIDRPFGNEASYWTMGIPHRLGEVEVTRTDDEVTVRVEDAGEQALRVRLARPRPASPAMVLRERLYTYIDGVPHAVPLDIGFPESTLDPATVHVEVGEGPLADTLRAVGLPEHPPLSAWGEQLEAAFHLPEPLVG